MKEAHRNPQARSADRRSPWRAPRPFRRPPRPARRHSPRPSRGRRSPSGRSPRSATRDLPETSSRGPGTKSSSPGGQMRPRSDGRPPSLWPGSVWLAREATFRSAGRPASGFRRSRRCAHQGQECHETPQYPCRGQLLHGQWFLWAAHSLRSTCSRTGSYLASKTNRGSVSRSKLNPATNW
jgi:hypothetical protein